MHRDAATKYTLPYTVRQQCYLCSEEHDGEQKLCYFCEHERIKVAMHCSKSKHDCLPCDLTLEQWIETVKDFEWKCAYCRKEHYTVLEHFIPRNLGGGTTKTNCIPACHSCNARKLRLHPTLVTRIPQVAIERVQKYLQMF